MVRFRRVRRQVEGRENVPRNSQLPKSRETRLVCLPCQPSPARSASGFSISGAVSTKTLTSAPNRPAIRRASALSRFLTTS